MQIIVLSVATTGIKYPLNNSSISFIFFLNHIGAPFNLYHNKPILSTAKDNSIAVLNINLNLSTFQLAIFNKDSLI